jgi:hypothetical protein
MVHDLVSELGMAPEPIKNIYEDWSLTNPLKMGPGSVNNLIFGPTDTRRVDFGMGTLTTSYNNGNAPKRGGGFQSGTSSGIFNTDLGANWATEGFRCAYLP